MDIYDTRAQLAAIDLMEPEYSFLHDMTVRDGGTVEDDKALYDYRKGSRRMAPVVHPGTGGVLMERDGFQTREIGFATVAPERAIEVNQLYGRSFGERILGAMTPAERAKKVQAKDIVDMRKAIQRRREHMVRQVALTGSLELFEYTNEGRSKRANLIANYGFTNNFVPGSDSAAWDQTGAKIESDMQKMLDMAQAGLGVVEWIIMAPDVANALLYNSDYVKRLDIRNVNIGEINARYRGQGVRFIGHNIDGVEMYSFAGTFVDDDGVVKPIMPSGKLIMGYKGMLIEYHGPVTQVEKMDGDPITYIKKEVPLKYSSIESNSTKNRLTSCPTIVPENIDGWVIGDVL